MKRTKTTDRSWAVYIGGIYEKHSDGPITKYYGLGGQTVAMRTVPVGGGAPETNLTCQNTVDDDADGIINDGCLLYLLRGHLGGTTEVLSSSGATVSELKYWPYGAVRAGGVPQTDKCTRGSSRSRGMRWGCTTIARGSTARWWGGL